MELKDKFKLEYPSTEKILVNKKGYITYIPAAESDENREGYLVNISLVSKEIIEYDLKWLNDGSKDDSNVSYFYFYEFFSDDIIYYPDFKEDVLYDIELHLEETKDSIKGYVVIAASPVSRHKAYAIIRKSKDSLLEGTAKKSNIINMYRNFIESKAKYFGKNIYPGDFSLDKVKNRYNFFDMKVFNIEQANATFVKLSNKKGFFFDIGFPIQSIDNKDRMDTIMNGYMYNQNPSTIILSHFDADHFLGVAYMKSSIFEIEWIVPDIKNLKLGLSVLRLLSHIIRSNGTLIIIPETYKKNFVHTFNNINISLYKGEAIRTNRSITKENNAGLILQIHNNKNILLPGDASYDVFHSNLNIVYDVILVPHHGSKMSSPSVYGSKYGKAIFQYSASNKYGHPDGVHIYNLLLSGFLPKYLNALELYYMQLFV